MERTGVIGTTVLILCGAIAFGQAADKPSLDALAEDTPVLRVLDKTVFLKDINPPEDQQVSALMRRTPEQYAVWLQGQRRSLISQQFRPLLADYTESQKIQVSDEEARQFNQAMRASMLSKLEESKANIKSLSIQLKAENLDAKKRSELTAGLERERKIADSFADSIAVERPHAVSAGIYQNFILSWKVQQRLFNQYGGRVIFQQAGPEPLDAWKRFYQEQQREGRFEFFHPQAEALFWHYYTNDKMHIFLSDNGAKEAMETPWWLQDKPELPLHKGDAVSWGEAVNGIHIRIRTDRRSYPVGQLIRLMVDILNTDDTVFYGSSLEQFFVVELNDRRYELTGPKHYEVLSFGVGPNTVEYGFAEIALTNEWVKEGTPLTSYLQAGLHRIRLEYSPDMDRTLRDSVPISSNALVIEIVDPAGPQR